MRFWFSFFCLLMLSVTCGAQNMHALLIGVSEYPDYSGWTRTHADNDVRIVRDALRKEGFSDITILQDKQATYGGIVQALNTMEVKVTKDDYCLILFSCHGQLVTDLNHDEESRDGRDHYDEALVPYDAFIAYHWNGTDYHGENHLIDDELNQYLSAIAQKTGEDGQLLVLFDACHSGDMSRAKHYPTEVGRRGVYDAFRIPSGEVGLKDIPRPLGVDWFYLTACGSLENNYECLVDGDMYGRLAYSFAKVFRRGMTAEELDEEIQAVFKVLPTDPNKPIQTTNSFIPIRMRGIPLFK